MSSAVGVWFYSLETKRHLYLMRQDTRYPMSWGLPGGKVEPNESLLDAINRECVEELGFMPSYAKLIPLEKFTSTDDCFSYHTFFCCVEKEFQPQLNHEHMGYAWIDHQAYPKPMHPGLWNTVNFDVIRNKISVIQTSQ